MSSGLSHTHCRHITLHTRSISLLPDVISFVSIRGQCCICFALLHSCPRGSDNIKHTHTQTDTHILKDTDTHAHSDTHTYSKTETHSHSDRHTRTTHLDRDTDSHTLTYLIQSVFNCSQLVSTPELQRLCVGVRGQIREL